MNSLPAEAMREAADLLKKGKISEARSRYSSLLKNTDLSDEERGSLLTGRGIADYQLGRLDLAAKSLKAAREILQKTHGPASAEAAQAEVYLARVTALLGNPAGGQTLGQHALDTLEKTLPADAPQLAEACFLLSQAEYELHHLQKAEDLTRRAMGIWQAQEGPKSISVSTCLNNLGRIYEERGQTDEGIHWHRACLAIRREVLGTHPETAFSLGNLGTALAQNGAWQEAAETLAECVRMYESLGADPRLTGAYKRNLDICRQALEAAR